MDSRHSSSKTPCHQSYPCVASQKGNFADCDWFQCFLLCDAEKLGCPKMFSQGSAQRAAIRRRRAFCKITPSKRPFAFGCDRRTSSNWLAPRRAPTQKARIVDRRQRTPCRACKKYGRAARAAEIRIVRQPRRSWEHDRASTTFNTSGIGSGPAAETLVQNWWLFTLRGVLGIIFGCLALIFRCPTILSLVLLFSAYMLVDGIFGIISAVR